MTGALGGWAERGVPPPRQSAVAAVRKEADAMMHRIVGKLRSSNPSSKELPTELKEAAHRILWDLALLTLLIVPTAVLAAVTHVAFVLSRGRS